MVTNSKRNWIKTPKYKDCQTGYSRVDLRRLKRTFRRKSKVRKLDLEDIESDIEGSTNLWYT
jgi:hypothetical protein